MINLKKQDNVADVVNEILQQEALKGNQKKIDKNHNGKIDGQDFKILRGEKKVEEEIDMDDRTKDTLVGREKTKQKDDVGPNSNAKVSKFKLKSEEAEQIDEKNVPTSPEKWAQAKSAAKSKFAVYPSAYANGWASKKYKSMGGGWKATSEEVEQIDELSTSTLKSYISGAQKDRASQSDSKNSGDREEAAYAKKQIVKRTSGIVDAKSRLSKEEVESIDELSKDTLGSYLDKNKSEYMKGKTQSGSKENAKDIQNMGKAHDKMTLKKMKESFEEPILDEFINEVMSKDASAGDWIHDFVHSDNPKFAGKSKTKRKEMALAAYYSKKNEEVVNEGLKDMAKKTFKALTGGSDKDHLDRLKKDMYGGSEDKYAAKTLVKHAKDPLGLKKEEVVEEGWDDMVKAAQEKVKSGPKPSGGSGKKQGSAYGGSKQKDKPEQEVKEAKNPMMDAGVGSQPNFVTDSAKPMQAAQVMAKKSLAKMRSDMMAKKSK